jgi:hypothetical protein
MLREAHGAVRASRVDRTVGNPQDGTRPASWSLPIAMTTHPRSLLLIALAAAAPGVEYASAPTDADRHRARRERVEPPPPDYIAVKDLRLSFGVVQGPHRISTDNFPGLPQGSYDVEHERFPIGSLTYTYGRLHRGGGPIIATGIDYSRGTATARTPLGGADFDFERYDGLIKVGYGVGFGPRVHLEILPYLGAGFGSTSARGGTSDGQAVGEVGIDGGLYYHAGLACLGASAGINATSWSGDTALHAHGLQAMLSAGFAF